MSKRILVGLLVMSMAATWSSDALAFNRINGILIRHTDLNVTVFLSGVGQNVIATVALEAIVEILCTNPQDKSTNPGTPELQPVSQTQSQVVTRDQFDGNGQASVTFVFDFSGLTCHQKNFKKVPESELTAGLVATIAYKQCNGTEPGPDGIRDGDPCFEFGGTSETVKVLEVVETTCEPGIRNPDGTVPSQELTCDSQVVAHQGGKK
jgi:hypothetical protein